MAKRKNNWKILCIGITICFSFYTRACFSQHIQTFTDKNNILIGEQLQYKVRASFPAGVFSVRWFSIPDSVAHFEVVDKSKIDTSAENGNTVLQQTVILTSFDSGKWNTPAFAVDFFPVKGNAATNLFTDSIAIIVSYSPPDSTNELRDIKPIIKVTIADYTWYYIIGGIVLLLLFIILIYRYRKKRKRSEPDVVLSKFSPYDEAMQEINKLAQYNLQNADEVKLYHIKLAGIFKRYLGRKQNKNLLTKTTGDLLIRMTESGMATGNVSNLATALRCTDAVKFAKYLPVSSESEDCKQKIKETIELIERQTTNNKS